MIYQDVPIEDFGEATVEHIKDLRKSLSDSADSQQEAWKDRSKTQARITTLTKLLENVVPNHKEIVAQCKDLHLHEQSHDYWICHLLQRQRPLNSYSEVQSQGLVGGTGGQSDECNALSEQLEPTGLTQKQFE